MFLPVATTTFLTNHEDSDRDVRNASAVENGPEKAGKPPAVLAASNGEFRVTAAHTNANRSPWQTPLDLSGQVAVVTGGSRGIGRAVVHSLAQRKCRIVVAARSAEAVAEVVDALPEAVGFPGCDVRDADCVESLLHHAEERFGRVDILVCSAGIGQSPRASRGAPQAVISMDDVAFDDVVDTNLRGLFLTARAAARRMLAQRSGQIIDISSARGARRGQGYGAAYCASKMAARAMMEAMAEELAPYGIRVMSLLPDAVNTSLIAGTTLAPRGALEPDWVGEFVAEMLSMPLDATFDKPLLAPLGARQRTTRSNSAPKPARETS